MSDAGPVDFASGREPGGSAPVWMAVTGIVARIDIPYQNDYSVLHGQDIRI
jgi:hypothetical protein